MVGELQLIYASGNGDRWFLGRDADGKPWVRHEPNRSSGGRPTDVGADEFLSRHDTGPQYDMLRAMLLPGEPGMVPTKLAQPVTPALVRAARGLLGWTRERLAQEAHLSLDDVRTCEDGDAAVPHETVLRVAHVLTLSGVVFVGEGEVTGGGPGVRMGALGTSTGQPHEAPQADANDNREAGHEQSSLRSGSS
jgi:hypothetical protein